jgi:hypothetical protein
MAGTCRRELGGSLARVRALPRALRIREAEAEMKRRSDVSLECRQRLLPLAAAVVPRRAVNPEIVGPVWQYWHDGADRAPTLLRRCMESVERHLSQPVIRLSDDNYSDYVSMPDWLRGKEGITRTHFSDILRYHLLAEHGGTWVDATVMLSGPVPVDLAESPFFAFTRPSDPMLLASWFIRSSAGHPLAVCCRDVMVAYWSREESLCDYFLVHHVFEALVTYHSSLRKLWTSTPCYSFEPPHLLQRMLLNDYEAEPVAEVLKQIWIHKLTYKLPAREPSDRSFKVLDFLSAASFGR